MQVFAFVFEEILRFYLSKRYVSLGHDADVDQGQDLRVVVLLFVAVDGDKLGHDLLGELFANTLDLAGDEVLTDLEGYLATVFRFYPIKDLSVLNISFLLHYLFLTQLFFLSGKY